MSILHSLPEETHVAMVTGRYAPKGRKVVRSPSKSLVQLMTNAAVHVQSLEDC